MRARLPVDRRRRFDEGRVGGALIIAAGLLVSSLLFVLGHALRAVDDNLAEFTPPD